MPNQQKSPVKTGEKQDTKFQSGQSGNPSGRPSGSRNKATLAVQALLEGEAEALGRKAVDMALEGDTTALRLVMERIAPVRKGRAVQFDIPKIETPADVVAAMGAIAEQMAAGDMTPEEAQIAAGVLEAKRKALETEEIEKRITALENKR